MGLSCTPHFKVHPLLAIGRKSWNFIKSGYEILGLRSKCTWLENICSYSSHRNAAVIGWKRSGKSRTGQTQFGTEFHALLKPSILCFFFLFLNSRPLCDEIGGFACRLLPDFTDNFNILQNISKDSSIPFKKISLRNVFLKKSAFLKII